MARLSVTVDDDLKRDFLAAAHEYGSSGAALVRAFMQAVVDGGRDLDGLRDQVRADLEHPAPARTPAARASLPRRSPEPTRSGRSWPVCLITFAPAMW